MGGRARGAGCAAGSGGGRGRGLGGQSLPRPSLGVAALPRRQDGGELRLEAAGTGAQLCRWRGRAMWPRGAVAASRVAAVSRVSGSVAGSATACAIASRWARGARTPEPSEWAAQLRRVLSPVRVRRAPIERVRETGLRGPGARLGERGVAAEAGASEKRSPGASMPPQAVLGVAVSAGASGSASALGGSRARAALPASVPSSGG